MATSKRNRSLENSAPKSRPKRSCRDESPSEMRAAPDLGAGEASESELRGSARPSREYEPGSAFTNTKPAASGRTTTPLQNPKKQKKKREFRRRRHPQGRTTDTTITQGVMNSAKDADPNQGRCLLENTDDGVQAAHIIRRSTDHGLVHSSSFRLSIHLNDICSCEYSNGRGR
jgi:hypothetical protein